MKKLLTALCLLSSPAWAYQVPLYGAFSQGALGTSTTSAAATTSSSIGANAGGSNTQIQFNNVGAFGGAASATYTTGTGLTTLGNVSGTNNVTINGNLGVTGTTTLTGALTASGGVSATNLSASGNLDVTGTTRVQGISATTIGATGIISDSAGLVVSSTTGNVSFTMVGPLYLESAAPTVIQNRPGIGAFLTEVYNPLGLGFRVSGTLTPELKVDNNGVIAGRTSTGVNAPNTLFVSGTLGVLGQASMTQVLYNSPTTLPVCNAGNKGNQFFNFTTNCMNYCDGTANRQVTSLAGSCT